MKRFVFALVLLTVCIGCRHTPPTVVTPQGKIAYHLEPAIDALNSLQHQAIVLNKAGKLSDTATANVVRYRRSAVTVMDKAIDNGKGCLAALKDVGNGLEQVEAALLATERPSLVAALT